MDLKQHKPLFITTVPTGVFLDPIKFEPSPVIQRKVYHYSSHPRVVLSEKLNSNVESKEDVSKETTTTVKRISRSIPTLPQIDNKLRENR